MPQTETYELGQLWSVVKAIAVLIGERDTMLASQLIVLLKQEMPSRNSPQIDGLIATLSNIQSDCDE